jgi:hypothetical protein
LKSELEIKKYLSLLPLMQRFLKKSGYTGVAPHAQQAKKLIHPQNEKKLAFFVLGVFENFNLMGMCYYLRVIKQD